MPSENRSRNELNETQDKQAEDMRELHEHLEKKAEDLTTVRRLLEDLDLGGATSEGAVELEGAVDRAERVTEEVFDQDDDALERVQSDAEEERSEVNERKDTSENNLGHITDATAPLDTQETIDQIREGKEAILADIDFLQELVQRAKDTIEESENTQKDLRNIRSGKGQ